MASISNTVDIIFGAIDNFSAIASNVKKQIGEIDDAVGKMRSMAQPAADFTTGMLKVEAGIAAVAVAAGAYAYKEAVEFESSFTDLKKVLGESETDLDSYKDSMKALSGKFGVVVGDVVNGTTAFKQAGYTIDESLKLTETVLTAVKIADMGAEEASSLLISTLAGFGMRATESTRVLDVWNSASDAFAVNTKEIARGVADFGPIAKQAGLSLEETTGLLIPVIEIFGSGSEAANSLKSGLLNLVAAPKPVQESMDQLGVALKTSDGQLRSVSDVLEDLAKKWPKLTNEQKLYYAGELFGKEQAAKMSVVLGDYKKSLEATEVVMKSAGSAQTELGKKLQGGAIAIERLQTAFNLAAISIGSEYEPNMNKVVNATTKLVDAFDSTVKSGGLKPLFDLLRPLLDEFANELEGISRALPEAFKSVDFGPLVQSLKALSQEFGTAFDSLFSGDLDLTKAEDLTQFLQGLIDLTATFITATAGVIESMQPIFAGLGEMAARIGEGDAEMAKSAGNVMGTLTVFAEGGVALAGFIVYMNQSKASIKEVFEELIGAAGVFWNTLQASFDRFALIIVRSQEYYTGFLSKITFGDTSKNFEAASQKLELIGDGISKNFDQNVSELAANWKRFQDAGETSTTATAKNTQEMTQKVARSTGEISGKLAEQRAAIEKVEIQTKQTISLAQIAATTESKRIEAATQTTSLAIKSAAEVSLAGIKASAEKVKQVLDTVGKVVGSTENSLSKLFGELANTEDPFKLADLRYAIREETEMRRKAVDDAHRLTKVEIALGEKKLEQLKAGGGLITVQADGLEPELEAFMWKIVKKLQVRVAEDQAEFLLGWGGSA